MRKQKVLITRTAEQSEEFANKLEHVGYEARTLPLIKTKLAEDLAGIQAALEQLEKYDWLIFTSANAVRFFFQVVEQFNVKLYYYSELKIATVGEKTKHYLEQLGYRTNFVPIKYTAEVLADNIGEIEGKRILIPRSSSARDNYIDALNKRGAIVEALNLYDTIPLEYSSQQFAQETGDSLDIITFASPSAVRAFHANQAQSNFEISNEKIVCIGPSTAKEAKALGFEVEAIAEPHTVEGMIKAIDKIKVHD